MYTAVSRFNVLAWKCQLHATWRRRRIYTYKKRWRQQNTGWWGGGRRGVVTQFFILRQGLKECAGIVKSAASELLSPFSSFFLLYFPQSEFRYVAARLWSDSDSDSKQRFPQMYESWRTRIFTRFILHRDLHSCCSGFYGTAVEQEIGYVTKETRGDI